MLGRAALAVALAAGVGCRDRREQDGRWSVHLARVTDRSAGEARLPGAAAENALERAFSSHRSFSLVRGDQGLAAELWFAEQPAADGARDLIVGLRLETPPGLDGRLGEDGLEANVLLERESGDAGLEQDLGLALARAVAVLEARVGLGRGDPRSIEALLRSADPELALLALEWIRDGRSTADPDVVAALLDHADERVALVAIEALGRVGGPEHVHALLAGVRLSNPGHAHRTYEALAALGGPDAAAFLEFAARNEDEPERRQAANSALARLGRGDPPRDVVQSAEALPVRGHRR
jgi:hypothetical protein